ncbi:hypothetical protein XENOCAPTIV_007931 [Xenoophorus captivus]|uniref:Uncharacterized protein n=1 Tax=Xenoophorus captivus TaxID=1517983 RepID=A0ABV0RPS9_9TELE
MSNIMKANRVVNTVPSQKDISNDLGTVVLDILRLSHPLQEQSFPDKICKINKLIKSLESVAVVLKEMWVKFSFSNKKEINCFLSFNKAGKIKLTASSAFQVFSNRSKMIKKGN